MTLMHDEVMSLVDGALHSCSRAARELDDEPATLLLRAHDLIARAIEYHDVPGSEKFERQATQVPTDVQLDEVRRRMGRTRPAPTIFLEPFDLPEGYILVRFTDGFECGISRDGAVSS